MPAKPSFEPSACIAPIAPSLDVLHLLAQPLDRGLELEADAGELDVGRLGAQRVGLAVELLAQEVEPAPDRTAGGEQAAGGCEMRRQAVQLLAHVAPGDQHRD